MTLPALLSILPALLAISAAFVLRRVALSLGLGVLLGAFLAGPLASVPARLFRYFSGALLDGSHPFILSFALLLGGLMGLMRGTGGSQRLAQQVARMARSSRGGQLTAWTLGLVFFFDDYANTMFVGSTMGPAAPRLRISREKLAFIIDATAAPVASIAPISSWIAVELGYIADQLRLLDLPQDAYAVFVETIPLRFYPLLMLVFGVLIALLRRDFGPMLAAEREAARALDEQAREETHGHAAQRPRKGRALPLLLGFLALLVGLFVSGRQGAIAAGREPELSAVLEFASSSKALVLATGATVLAALLQAALEGREAFRNARSTLLPGMLGMVEVALVLMLAWALGAVCADLETARHLVSLLGGSMSPGLVPMAVFLLSAAVSFATGTSWGTMGILFPLSVPLIAELAPGDHDLLVMTIASVLSGSVFGDHCSPISDTTIMSALSVNCDQLAHVRTQLPYALVVAFASVALGLLPAGVFGLPAWACLLLGSAALATLLWLFGRTADAAGQAP